MVLKQVQLLTENVLLIYFSKRAEKIKPSTLWSDYSMIRAIKMDVDLKKFLKLTPSMKNQSVGSQCKKTNVFTKEDIHTFLKKVPDNRYLMMKVVIIFGIAGACRTSKTNKPRSFVIHCQSIKTIKINIM
ncbi:hypothetical protein Zmor_020590 [Zophobas morio]|uniref:Uncharacterized protein n=1 Tax=Zophobas morio TaxID=2755281 RepID=A0AA38MAH8_9CUCU|nr:hypothetical protein Zmor_020590 [Zophobas morio]